MIEVDARLAAALAERYRLLGELGRGGTATVYLAEDLRHPRRVAVKVLHPEMVLRGSVERFLREIEIAAHLQHPHILPLLDSGEHDGFLYFAMPYVEGETLRDRLRRDGQLPVPDILRILGDVVDAVAHAHDRGVVHRDIKPENILLAGRHALVTDFGVARALSIAGGQEGLTQGVAIGTPAYMAPEQAMASPELDHRVDIYALGVLAYELLAGRPPFTGPGAQEILTAHVVLTPEPVTSYRADTPAGLVAIIGRCLAKQPRDRYQDASALLAELDPLVTPSGGLTPTGTAPVRPRRRWRPWALVGALGAVLVATVLALAPRGAPAPGSGTWRQLTFRGDVLETALSPDGQFLAYATARDGLEHLFVHDLEGDAALKLAEGNRLRRLDWSPDGTEIRFFRSNDSLNEMLAVPRLGGTLRRLPSSGYSSPDGRKTAAIPSNGGRLRVYDLATGDSTIIPLPVGDRIAAGLSWSPDGELLSVRTLDPASENASFYVAMPATGKGREVLRDSTMLTEPAWSPDGSALYYFRRWRGVVSLWRLRVTPGGDPDGSPHLVATGLPEPDFANLLTTRPSVGRDGRRFVYKAVETRSNLARIALTGPASGMGLHPLTSGTAEHPDARFSEDGQKIAFIRREGDGAVLGLLPFGGGMPETVARLVRAHDVAWSPDGMAIVVTGLSAGDAAEALHIFSLTGRPERSALRGRTSSGVEWLQDGRIVYARYGQSRMGVFDPRTGADTVIALPDTSGWVFWPRATRDSRRLVYGWNPATGRSPLWVVPIAGGTPWNVGRDGWAPLRVLANGREFYAVRRTSTLDALEVAVLPMDGGRPRTLISLPPGTRALDVSPDGRTLLLSTREHRADVWEVTLPPSR